MVVDNICLPKRLSPELDFFSVTMALFTKLSLYILLITLLFVAIGKYGWNKSKKSQYHYAPGPEGHWLFGNAPDFPKNSMGLKLAEWGNSYGDM